MNVALAPISSLPWWRALSFGAAVTLGFIAIRRLWFPHLQPDEPTEAKDRSETQASAAVAENASAEASPPGEVAPALQPGQRVVIEGLEARPDLNNQAGLLIFFYAEKDRWAVRVEGSQEPMLLRPDKLRIHPEQPQRPSNEMVWAGQRVRFFSIESYTSAKGGDEVFEELQEFRPGVVLMESFNAGEDREVLPGDVVPYKDSISPSGLAQAMEKIADPDFRKAMTAEAVAVFAALRLGAEIRLGDRLLVTSFDRLIDKYSTDDLKNILVTAMEGIAKKIESSGRHLSDLETASLSPYFPELGSERHEIMAHFARQAAETGHDTLVILGAEHVPEVKRLMWQKADLLNVTPLLRRSMTDSESELAHREELVKRCVLAAFLSTTRCFPPEMVLPERERLLPEYQELVAKSFPRHKEAFMNRLTEAFGGPEQLAKAYASRITEERARGLDRLAELCES